MYKDPACNNVRYRTGCLLDGLEKTCESVKDLTKCAADAATCKDMEEFPVTPEIFDSSARVGREGLPAESVWKCCCPAPDGKPEPNGRSAPYTEKGCSNPDPACMKIVQDTVLSESAKRMPQFKACLDKADSAACKASLEGVKVLGVKLQEARGKLLASQPKQCAAMPDKLAPMEPISQCGDAVKPEAGKDGNMQAPWSRSIERAALYCDAISWQFYEMGSSDAFSEQCPNHPKATAPWVASSMGNAALESGPADANTDESGEATELNVSDDGEVEEQPAPTPPGEEAPVASGPSNAKDEV
jgi:hypothetical protein